MRDERIVDTVKTDKLDFKKEYKDLYAPGNEPVLIDVPEMTFITVEGTEKTDSEAFVSAIRKLYSVSYMIKMRFKDHPGYYEYVVPPLEGLWDVDFDADEWKWMLMIRQPGFVDERIFNEAIKMAEKKNPELSYEGVRLECITDGPSVQIMHIGPYVEEHTSLEKIQRSIEAIGMSVRKYKGYYHREIYLSDPERTAPEKLKTVLRVSVDKK